MANSEIDGIGMTSLRTRKRLVESLQRSGISNEYVLRVILDTPRHMFIDEAMAHRSYEDLPLPIGYGQTISQPYIVAKMTEAILGDRSHLENVLEIGTGSGYQAAILAKLAKKVYSIERIRELLTLAKRKFSKLRLYNIVAKHDDGSSGWQEYAPYDGIIVTCAVQEIPLELLQQLKDGGRLVIPIGNDAGNQQLQIVTKINNSYNTTYLDLVRFLPLLSGKE